MRTGVTRVDTIFFCLRGEAKRRPRGGGKLGRGGQGGKGGFDEGGMDVRGKKKEKKSVTPSGPYHDGDRQEHDGG